ncbi:ArsR/SmtB family transcription factor [Roseicella aquatilis]|uniref:Metalloregulator ArsR/SmtB family transcription factor n=1 Tax=Roseicella aquatilis TaxID=2527868 RepID=A0A4V2WJH8_9PROT|nr:metalloregulator ArsR/SmtB family transcription factor [Roseicella aquatilis]TCZ53620.1 metalloregulator ArsR/SmtB family transcription factor [Roseicella aquatilis]
MDEFLAQLRAVAEPTRLRLLALCARGAFRVTDLCEILGQSQPRLSRHLKLLVDAGVLDRVPEGANAYFQLPQGAELARLLLARLPEDDPLLAADRRAAVRLAAERAREASEAFRRDGADWDEIRALDLPAEAIEQAVLARLPSGISRFLDIGTGTGRLLELVADRAERCLGIDASREMLALARARLSERGLAGRCAVRQADMYRLPFEDGCFDVVALQMVLHYAEEPGAALAEAARVLRPDGQLVIVDLGPHGKAGLAAEHAHRWPGFADDEIGDWLGMAGCRLDPPAILPGPVEIRVWSAHRVAAALDLTPALTF